MVPMLLREILEGSPTSRLAMAAGQALLAAGYHQQVPVRPGFLNLFVVVEGQRRALGFQRRDGRGARRWAALERRGSGAGVGVEPRRLEPRRAAAPGGAGRAPAHRRLRGRAGRDRLPRADRALVRALRRSAAGAATPAERDARGARAGSRPRGRRPEDDRPAGRSRRARGPLGARGLSRDRGGVRPGPRGGGARAAAVEDALGALDPTLRGAADAARGRALHPHQALHEKSLARPEEARPGPGRPPAPHPRRALPRRRLPGARAVVLRRARPPRPALLADLEEASTPGPAATRSSIYEDRNRLLPHRGRLGGGGRRARQAARPPRTRHPFHLLSAALPPRRLPGEHLLPRGRRLDLRASSSTRPTTSPSPRRWRRPAASTTSTSSTCTTRSPTPSRASSPRRCWATIRPSSSPPCTAPTSPWWARTGPSSRSPSSASSAADGVTAVSEFLRRMTVDEFQIKKPIEAIPNFVDLQAYSPERPTATPPLARPGQKILMHASNFRPVKRISDVIRIFERVARESDAVLAHGGRGPGARRPPRPWPVAWASPTACASWGCTRHRRARGPGRRLPAPLRARVLRPLRPRGPGLRRARGGLRRGRPARGGEACGDRASCSQWATSRAWPRAPSRS